VADVYEIARAGLELAEKATPGPWRGDRWDGTVKYAVLAAPEPNASFTEETAEQWIEILTVDHKNGTSGFDGPQASENEALVLHAGTHYAALCRAVIEAEQTRLAQKAVVEAAVEQERQRFLADEARAARQDLETQAQHTEDYRSACRMTNAAVRAMKEQTR